MHVDEFIDRCGNEWVEDRNTRYAAWMFAQFRYSATLQSAWREFYADHKLFCTHQGTRYRVTGASRLGDVWLVKDFTVDYGYDVRANIEDCTQWGAEP